MQKIHTVHHRKNIRIKDYDYSTENLYFVTICTQNRKEILGKIVGDISYPKMQLTEFGKFVEITYHKTINNYKMKTHNYVIMPNHIHAIIEIRERAGTRPAPTICDVIRDIKSITTLEYIKAVKENRASAFNKRIWQRNYYEHIIRNEKEYLKTCEYIQNNILNWKYDEYLT